MLLLLCSVMWNWLPAPHLLLVLTLSQPDESISQTYQCALLSLSPCIKPTAVPRVHFYKFQCSFSLCRVRITHRIHHLCTGMFQFCQKCVTVSEFLKESANKRIEALQGLNNVSKAVGSKRMKMESQESFFLCRNIGNDRNYPTVH